MGKAMSDSTIRVDAKQMRQLIAQAGGADKVSVQDVMKAVQAGSPLMVGAGQTGELLTVNARKSKYRNVRTVVDGETFDSKREAQYWHELKLREKVGEIHGLKRQVPFDLLCPEVLWEGLVVDTNVEVFTRRVSQYVADFVYYDHFKDGAYWGLHVVDAKGKRTALYQLKKKWLELQSGLIIEEV